MSDCGMGCSALPSTASMPDRMLFHILGQPPVKVSEESGVQIHRHVYAGVRLKPLLIEVGGWSPLLVGDIQIPRMSSIGRAIRTNPRATQAFGQDKFLIVRKEWDRPILRGFPLMEGCLPSIDEFCNFVVGSVGQSAWYGRDKCLGAVLTAWALGIDSEATTNPGENDRLLEKAMRKLALSVRGLWLTAIDMQSELKHWEDIVAIMGIKGNADFRPSSMTFTRRVHQTPEWKASLSLKTWFSPPFVRPAPPKFLWGSQEEKDIAERALYQSGEEGQMEVIRRLNGSIRTQALVNKKMGKSGGTITVPRKGVPISRWERG